MLGATGMRLLIFRLLAITIGLAVALVLTEACLRLLDLAPTSGLSTVTDREFGKVPGIFAPGRRIVERSIPELEHIVTIDSLGYRGADFARSKAPGEWRILMIGDSYTFGSYVDDEATLPALVEAEVRKSCSRHVTVVNAGLGGSTISDQVRLLERALVLEPDVVVLTFSENDLMDLVGPTLWERLAANRSAKSRFPLSVVYPVARETALWNLLLRARSIQFTREVHAAAATPGAESIDPAKQQELGEKYREHLTALSDTLAARRIPLLFAAYPGHWAVADSASSGLVEWALDAARAEGIQAVDLLTPLRESGLATTALFLLPHDGHPSAAGHAIAARVIARRLTGGGAAGGCRGVAPEGPDA